MLAKIWHIIARVVGVLVLNPPSLPGWATWFLLVIRTVVVVVIFRRNVGPFMLAKMSRRIRARSVSPRSIKGLYFRSHGRTWRVDRIGWTFNPWRESLLSVKIEGLRVEVAAPQMRIRRRGTSFYHLTTQGRILSFATIQEFATFLFERISIFTWFYKKVLSISVAFARLIVQYLPSLTRNLDFELDSIVISFAALSGARLVVEGIVLSTRVDFSHSEKKVENVGHGAKNISLETNRGKAFSWYSLTRSNADRFWDRLWGHTQVFASVNVTFNEVGIYTQPSSSPMHVSTLPLEDPSQPTSETYPLMKPRRPRPVIHVAAPIRFVASLQFIPQQLAVKRKSVDCLLDIPRVDVSADGVRFLYNLKKNHPQMVEPMSPAASYDTSTFDIFPEPAHSPMAGSHTSPLLTAFSHITRHVKSTSSIQRIRDSMEHNFVSLFKSFRFQLSAVRITHDSLINVVNHETTKYVAGLDNLRLALTLSDPRINSLHREWLGSGEYSALDGAVLNGSCNFDLATLECFTNGAKSATCLLALHRLTFNIAAANWPQPWIPAAAIFPGNPNDSFISCEINMSSIKVDMSERLERLVRMMPANQTPTSSHHLIETMKRVPRVEFRAVCGEVRVCVVCDSEDNVEDTLTLDVRTAGFTVGLSATYYAFANTRPQDMDQATHNDAVRLDFHGCANFQPIFGRKLCMDRFLSTSQSQSGTCDDELLLALDTLELFVKGHTLGHSESTEVVILPGTTVMNVQCITELVSLELWKVEHITAWRILLDAFRTRDAFSKDTVIRSKPRFYLPGISFHVAVGCFTSIINSKDINPNCDLDLSRGIVVYTGCSFQYCCIKRLDYTWRPRREVPSVDLRKTLGLNESTLDRSMASNEQSGSDDILASFGCETWSTMCLNATSTPYVSDRLERPVISEKLRREALISVPQMFIKVSLRRKRSVPPTDGKEIEETSDISVELPRVMSRLDLFNLYCSVLAMHTLQFLTQRARSYPPQTRSLSSIIFAVHMRIGSIQILCHFPLHERLFLHVFPLSLEWGPDKNTKAHIGSVSVCVPSVQVSEKWEELSYIRHLTVTLNRSLPAVESIVVVGIRVVIPHQYVLSELILNIVLALKTLRHLHRSVNSGHYTTVAPPVSEMPKRLPKVDVSIRFMCLEAADNLFDAKLGLILRHGYQAQKLRIERELAFEAKLRSILASGDPTASRDTSSQSGLHYRFTSKRTTSVDDARNRLNLIHSNSWFTNITRQKEDIVKKEEHIIRQFHHVGHKAGAYMPVPIFMHSQESVPPLLRAVINDLTLSITPPSFRGGYEDFVYELGSVPRSTEYSLLLPMHLHLELKAARINLRDYPLPLLNVPFQHNGPSVEFTTDLVIAEEMGTADSVEWYQCPVYQENAGIVGAKAFYVRVPKTIMPVKSYANPTIRFRTQGVTDFTWGVSYNPAMQEVMRVIESLSHPSRDPSPAIGFWDKIRLVFHWRAVIKFEGGARLHFKGSRDPYRITGTGAGFDFCWAGNVAIRVGYANKERELIQLTSDSMTITIPNHQNAQDTTSIRGFSEPSLESLGQRRNDAKVCAKFTKGIRWGVGIALERTCGNECKTCRGDEFFRECRYFTFIPHYQVFLRTPASDRKYEDHDSYAGFRSNFIHLSTSLTSPLTNREHNGQNSFHLTPGAFAHFWSWWHLFSDTLSLPIRQGRLFPDSRPPSKKFGRHLATLKYRISFEPLYITHVYKVDDGDAWSAGESRCVGVKAFIEHFQADMHQREEISKPTDEGNNRQAAKHKPFSLVEVVIKGLDLRALFAVFPEPQKKSITLKDSLPYTANFWEKLRPTPLTSSWVDKDDFVELDWSPKGFNPNLFLFEAASCPRFVYLRRNPKASQSEDKNGTSQQKHKTKFGDEDTHFCLIGKEPTTQEIQLEFGATRLTELRAHVADFMGRTNNASAKLFQEHGPNTLPADINNEAREARVVQMIGLLERYVNHLSHLHPIDLGTGERGHRTQEDLYDMPADIKIPLAGEFINVYQVHCPKICLSNATRNILQYYYLASRARRGYEYHMSTRAVKFIRDQARFTEALVPDSGDFGKRQRYAAAQAFRRILIGEERDPSGNAQRPERKTLPSTSSTDPLFGWGKGISERKAHLCLLLKPQVVLRSDNSTRTMLVLAADHVLLRNHGILDTSNAEDPVSGNVMQRNYADIKSLQMFQPVADSDADYLPFEVFVDLRCESRDFDRLMPPTQATLRYDKFNRLRLRNNVTTVAISSPGDSDMVDHLVHETDLIIVQVPRFSVSADSSAFSSISDVVTNLLLYQDPVHKARMTQLETMLFSYDFTDLVSASEVIADLQARIQQLIRVEEESALDLTNLDDISQHDLLVNKAHVLSLSQELNLIFDAIKLAQDKADERNQEKKSALRLQASSAEVSWQVIDENRELLAKLAVKGINYSWLSQRDSSSVSKLDVRDLQVFDGSPESLFPEVLAKHHDPPDHHMIRRGLFTEIQWSLLAPVGGISIYNHFEVELHPIRLAFETQLSNKLLDYLLPSRRLRQGEAEGSQSQDTFVGSDTNEGPILHRQHADADLRLVSSRSFSNLRSTAAESRVMEYHVAGIPKSQSSIALVDQGNSLESSNRTYARGGRPDGDALEMRQRAAQMTFVHIKIPSIYALLTVMKGRNVLVRDARLRTHDLEWRNRTWSLDELVGQFVPSDPSWKGWVKVAWQQHVFSVGGVVKELITKTQWGRMRKTHQEDSRVASASVERRSRFMPLDLASKRLTSRDDSDSGMESNTRSVLARQRRATSQPRTSSLIRTDDTLEFHESLAS